MGSVVKSVGGVFGLGGKGQPFGASNTGLTQKNFDISKESKKYEDIYAQQRTDAQTRQQAANTPALIQQLSQQAMGQGPSLAEAQLKSATNRNLSQQLAAAAGMRGRNPAATQRQVLTQQGDAGRQLAEQSAVARLQEQQQAMGQLTNQQQLADNMAQNATQQGFQTAIAPATSRQQYDLARAGIRATDRAGERQIFGGLLGAGASGLAAMSDENEKKNISSGQKDVSSFLDTLSAKSYEYKDTSKPGTAAGKRTGVMAQDLEKSEIGKALVHDTPHGKMVDIEQGFGAVLAAQAELNERLNAIEGKKKPQKMAEGGYVQQMEGQTDAFLNKLKGIDNTVNIDVKKPGQQEPKAEAGAEIHYGDSGARNVPRISNDFAHGGKVPGQAEVAGDSEQNDKVDVKLSPGEIVIPRSAAGSPEAASKFVQQLFAKEMFEGGRVPGDYKIDRITKSKMSDIFGRAASGKRRIGNNVGELEKSNHTNYEKAIERDARIDLQRDSERYQEQSEDIGERERKMEAASRYKKEKPDGMYEGGIVEQQNTAEEVTKQRALQKAAEYRKQALSGSSAASDMARHLSEQAEQDAINAGKRKRMLREGR